MGDAPLPASRPHLEKQEKINLISSRFPCAAPQPECYMISNYLLEIFLWVSCWGLLFQGYYSGCIVRKMRCNSTCYLIPKASSTFGQNPTSKSRSRTFIFCFTLASHHILDDKLRVGERAFSNHLLLIIEYRLISSFKRADVTPRGSLALEEASAREWNCSRFALTLICEQKHKENVRGTNSRQCL